MSYDPTRTPEETLIDAAAIAYAGVEAIRADGHRPARPDTTNMDKVAEFVIAYYSEACYGLGSFSENEINAVEHALKTLGYHEIIW